MGHGAELRSTAADNPIPGFTRASAAELFRSSEALACPSTAFHHFNCNDVAWPHSRLLAEVTYSEIVEVRL
jgi:hypothetical protein